MAPLRDGLVLLGPEALLGYDSHFTGATTYAKDHRSLSTSRVHSTYGETRKAHQLPSVFSALSLDSLWVAAVHSIWGPMTGACAPLRPMVRFSGHFSHIM